MLISLYDFGNGRQFVVIPNWLKIRQITEFRASEPVSGKTGVCRTIDFSGSVKVVKNRLAG